MMLKEIPEPWLSFLLEIDSSVNQEVEMHCLGGFVVSVIYGLERSTADVDVMMIAPRGISQHLLELAGKESVLHRKHKVHLDHVTIVTVS